MTITRSVLLVDDSEHLRALYKLALQATGKFHVVGEGQDGREGIAAARRDRPDIVLLDLSMPTMDGLEALGYIREASPRSHVVVLTGFRQDRLGGVAQELGATAYVEKGVDASRLAELLDDVLTKALPPYILPGDASTEGLLERARMLV